MSLARNGRLRTAPQMVPRGPVEIDWAHPLARGLLSYILLADGIGRDLVGVSGPLLRTGSALAQVGARGPGANFGNAANVALPAPGNPQVYTFEALIQLPPAAPGAAEAVCSYSSGSAGNGYNHDRSILVGPAFAVSFYVYTGSAVTISGPSLSAGTVHHLVATSSGSELTLYADGVPVAATAAGGGFNYGSPPPFFCIGNGNDEASFNGVVHYAAQRNVALTAPEAAQLAATPFAMLRPRFVPRRASLTGAAPTNIFARAYSLNFGRGIAASTALLSARATGDSTSRAASAAAASLFARADGSGISRGTTAASAELAARASAAGTSAAANEAALTAQGRASGTGTARTTPTAEAVLAARVAGTGTARGAAVNAAIIKATAGRAYGFGSLRGAIAAALAASGHAAGAGTARPTPAAEAALAARTSAAGTARGAAVSGAVVKATAGRAYGFGSIRGAGSAVVTTSGRAAGAGAARGAAGAVAALFARAWGWAFSRGATGAPTPIVPGIVIVLAADTRSATLAADTRSITLTD